MECKESEKNATNVILFEASGFGERLETHSGENSNKCNKWDDSLFGASHFRRHLETHSGGKENLHFLGHLFSKRVLKSTMEKKSNKWDEAIF